MDENDNVFQLWQYVLPLFLNSARHIRKRSIFVTYPTPLPLIRILINQHCATQCFSISATLSFSVDIRTISRTFTIPHITLDMWAIFSYFSWIFLKIFLNRWPHLTFSSSIRKSNIKVSSFLFETIWIQNCSIKILLEFSHIIIITLSLYFICLFNHLFFALLFWFLFIYLFCLKHK